MNIILCEVIASKSIYNVYKIFLTYCGFVTGHFIQKIYKKKDFCLKRVLIWRLGEQNVSSLNLKRPLRERGNLNYPAPKIKISDFGPYLAQKKYF